MPSEAFKDDSSTAWGPSASTLVSRRGTQCTTGVLQRSEAKDLLDLHGHGSHQLPERNSNAKTRKETDHKRGSTRRETTQMYIHIYIYTYDVVVKLLSGPVFAVSWAPEWSALRFLRWSTTILPDFCSALRFQIGVVGVPFFGAFWAGHIGKNRVGKQ